MGIFDFSGGSSVGGPGLSATANIPTLLQYLALGGNTADLEQISKKDFKKNKLGSIKVGKGKNKQYFKAITPEQIEGLLMKAQNAQVQQQKQAFEQLKESPFYDSLLADSQGSNADLAAANQQLAKQTLGGAAAAGLNLEDPLVQAKVLGGQALQGFGLQKQLAQQAGHLGLQLTTGSSSPLAAGQPVYNPQFYNAQAQNYFNQGLQSQMFNSNQDQEHFGATLGFMSGAMGGLAGLGMAGVMGNFGGPGGTY